MSLLVLRLGYITRTCMLVQMWLCPYAVHDFVRVLACGDCPDDGLLLSLRFEHPALT